MDTREYGTPAADQSAADNGAVVSSLTADGQGGRRHSLVDDLLGELSDEALPWDGEDELTSQDEEDDFPTVVEDMGDHRAEPEQASSSAFVDIPTIIDTRPPEQLLAELEGGSTGQDSSPATGFPKESPPTVLDTMDPRERFAAAAQQERENEGPAAAGGFVDIPTTVESVSAWERAGEDVQAPPAGDSSGVVRDAAEEPAAADSLPKRGRGEEVTQPEAKVPREFAAILAAEGFETTESLPKKKTGEEVTQPEAAAPGEIVDIRSAGYDIEELDPNDLEDLTSDAVDCDAYTVSEDPAESELLQGGWTPGAQSSSAGDSFPEVPTVMEVPDRDLLPEEVQEGVPVGLSRRRRPSEPRLPRTREEEERELSCETDPGLTEGETVPRWELKQDSFVERHWPMIVLTAATAFLAVVLLFVILRTC